MCQCMCSVMTKSKRVDFIEIGASQTCVFECRKNKKLNEKEY